MYLLEKEHEKCGEIWETLEVERDAEDDDDEKQEAKKVLVASIFQLDDGLMVYQINAQVDNSGINDLATKVSE